MEVEGNTYFAHFKDTIDLIVSNLTKNESNFKNFIPLKKRHYLISANIISSNNIENEIKQIYESLNLTTDTFYKIIQNSKSFYFTRTITQSSGKKRIIHEPSNEIKILQRYLLENFFYLNSDKIKFDDAVTGFIKDKSILDNTYVHLNKKYLMKIDLKDFFFSISRYTIFNILEYKFNLEYDLAYLYSKILTCDNFLPQGGITSPFISNLCLINFDKRVSNLINKINQNSVDAVYTRYADDLTFSFDKRINFNRFKNLIYKIIYEEGFSPNYKKTRILHKTQKQQVTGVIVNGEELSISKKKRDQLRLIFKIWKKFGRDEARRKYKEIFKSDYKNFNSQIRSYIAHCKMVNFTQGEKLEKLFYSVKDLG